MLDEDILTFDHRFLLFAIPSIKSLFKIVYQAQHTNIAPILYQTICSSKQGQKKDKVLEEELKLSREMGPLEEKARRRSQMAQPTIDQKQQDKSNSTYG